ncbi:MAG: hypothetical protein Q8L48_17240 [Archangium sp.]|nr:hypothetical protein [Archangium sp.]
MKSFALVLAFATVASAQPVDEARGVSAPKAPAARKVRRGLLIGGIASLGTLYLGSVVVAGFSVLIAGSLPVIPPERSPLVTLFIPIAGPFAALGNPRNQNPVGVALLVANGLAQLAGATLIVLGLVGDEEPAKAAAWLLTPGAPGSAAGASLTLRLP